MSERGEKGDFLRSTLSGHLAKFRKKGEGGKGEKGNFCCGKLDDRPSQYSVPIKY